MRNIDELFDDIKNGIEELAGDTIAEYKDKAISDWNKFIEKLKDDVRRWIELIEENKLTKDEFEFLIRSKKDLGEMFLLKQKGLTQAKIDKFRNGMVKLIIGTIFDLF